MEPNVPAIADASAWVECVRCKSRGREHHRRVGLPTLQQVKPPITFATALLLHLQQTQGGRA